MRRTSFVCLVFVLLLLAHPAAALITQPNGVILPRDSENSEVQLYTLFAERGEAIDYQADGLSEPALFSPRCDFRATLVLNETGTRYAVGWYNADPSDSTPPDVSEIHIIVPADAPIGTAITGADIRGHDDYAGGLIGFALVGGQTHYTEARYNPHCTGCATPGPWVMSVIYRSTTTANAFYVTFEDGNVGSNPGEFNNDGDYNDYVYFFEGLVCDGEGEPCDTGMPGICAQGLTECDGTTCRPSVTATTEVCNGLDDDCDGVADDEDGDPLCAGEEVCDRGVCVARCMGEFGCFAGLECNTAGLCVEASCLDVECDAGEVCRGGACGGPCAGIVCPGDQVCRVGRCVDPCDGVSCEEGRVCDGGVCRPDCSCAPCSAELACDADIGICRDPSCVGVDCSTTPGTVCRDGSCVDACAGAVCPAGHTCELGSCVPIEIEADAGVPVADAGARPDAGGMRADAGSADAGAGGPATGGCGCHAAGDGSPAPYALFAAFAAMLARRRRR